MGDFKTWWAKEEIFCGEGGMDAAQQAWEARDEEIGEITNAYNAALEFALNQTDDEAVMFLRAWQHGEWDEISEHFPDFNLLSASICKGGE